MPIETVPGTELMYDLIAFDGAGRERDTAGGPMRFQALQELCEGPIADVFRMSHGPGAPHGWPKRTREAWRTGASLTALPPATPTP